MKIKYIHDNYIYYYIFIIELNLKINIEILHYSKLIHIEQMKFHEIFEFVKCMKYTIKIQMNHIKNYINNFDQNKNKIKSKLNSKMNQSIFKINHKNS